MQKHELIIIPAVTNGASQNLPNNNIPFKLAIWWLMHAVISRYPDFTTERKRITIKSTIGSLSTTIYCRAIHLYACSIPKLLCKLLVDKVP